MNKIYHVIIKGRTLESRDLKELLARAVSAKRNLDRNSQVQARFHTQASSKNVSNPCSQTQQAAVL